MKRKVVRCSANIKASSKGTTEKLYDLIEFLEDEGVDVETILDKFLRYLPSDKSLELMKELAEECDVDLTDLY